MTDQSQQFASDNYSGICPEAWAAMEKANQGHERAYGDDQWTARASEYFRKLFENRLRSVLRLQRHRGQLAGAVVAVPELSQRDLLGDRPRRDRRMRCAGVLLQRLQAAYRTQRSRQADPRLDPRSGAQAPGHPLPQTARGDHHQATEVGSVYRPHELKAISATCKELGLNLHMDGARFSNACAFLGCTPAELTWKSGVDVLCFGGTKNGMAVGEAILFFNRQLAEDFDYRCKQAGQLASKMRFLSAPWVGLLEDGAWLRHGVHANRCAQLLCELVRDVPGVELMFPVEANGVFLQMSEPALEALRNKGWRFYTFIGSGGARFMCSWDTEEARVRELAADIRAAMKA